MVDVVQPEVRSRMMAGIQGRDTTPELIVRRGLHRLGFRYRLHDRRLPGKPDLVFPRYRAAIFVNGCFWHRHDCHLFKWPSTRQEFWRGKINANVERDIRNRAECERLGWRVLVVWECALKGRERVSADVLIARIAEWLRSGSESLEVTGQPGKDINSSSAL